MTPIISIGIPTTEKSKIDKDSKPASMANPLTIKFVLVPIKVTHPPSIAAYDNGINNLEGKKI